MTEHQQLVTIIAAKNGMPFALEPRQTALVVVDMQRYFTQPGFPFTEVFERMAPGVAAGYLRRVRETVIPCIQELLSTFRAVGGPVVFTGVGTEMGDGRELPCWLRALDELGIATLGQRIWPPVTDPSWAIDEALRPRPGEVVLNKLSAGAFATTGLEQRLRHQGIDSVVVTGVSTDVCVATTAREAADRGFLTVIVRDACTTLSEQMHQASLETFNLAMGWVRSGREVRELLGGASLREGSLRESSLSESSLQD